jgi:gas vesicle protein
MEWILTNLQWILPTIILPIVTWFGSKRHFQSRDLKDKDADIMAKNVSLYQKLLDDLDERYDNRVKKLEEDHKEEIKILKKEIADLKERVKLCEEN